MGLQWKQRLKGILHKISCRLQPWKYASEQLLGLEIGPGFIKVLKISTEDEPYLVENFGIEALPTGAIVKDEIKNPAAITQGLQSALSQAQAKVKNVALAIPRSSTIIKTILVDKRLNSADIESRAWVEANHHFPDLVGDIYLDFDIIGPSVQDPSQLDLLLVACRKDHVKPYLDILRENGLNPKVVDVNCYAFERALGLILLREPELKTVACLNLDYSISSLIVMDKGQLIYAHDHSYEGLYFSNQVQQYLKDKNPTVSLADTAYVDLLKAGLSAHLRHSMHFFYSSRPHIAIQKLVLGGDCAALPFLTTFIQQETGIETIVADPLEGMSFESSVNQAELKKQAHALMLCSGLALSKLKEMEL